MRIAAIHSHLNGYEHILTHTEALWAQIGDAIGSLDVRSCTFLHRAASSIDRDVYDPAAIVRGIAGGLLARGWERARGEEGLDSSADQARAASSSDSLPRRMRDQIATGSPRSHACHHFLKDRLMAAVIAASGGCDVCELSALPIACFVSGRIDASIEVLPMKSLCAQMPDGIISYERLHDELRRLGRGCPPTPLALLGIAE